MKSNKIYLLFFLFIFSFVSSQNENKYHNEKIGWTVIFPQGFENMNLQKQEVQTVITNQQKEEKKEIPKQKKEFEAIRFKGLNFNFLLVNFEKDDSVKNEILEIVKKQNNDLIEHLKTSKPQAKFETKITHETVDNIDFIKSLIKIDLGNNIFQNFLTYSAKIKNYYTNFSIFYVNENQETKELINAFKNSKFEK